MQKIIGALVLVIAGVNIYNGAEEYNALHPVVYAREPDAPKEVLIEAEINWTEDRIIQEIKSTFPEQPDLMVKVARCESGLRPDAKGPTNDHGLYQIHVPTHKANLDGVDLYDPKENIAFARKLYDANGLQPWKASKHCWDKKTS